MTKINVRFAQQNQMFIVLQFSLNYPPNQCLLSHTVALTPTLKGQGSQILVPRLRWTPPPCITTDPTMISLTAQS